MSARLLANVIETRLEVRGRGTEDDPKRTITQYWDTYGALLAEADPLPAPRTPFVSDLNAERARAIEACIQIVKEWDGQTADGQHLMASMRRLLPPSASPRAGDTKGDGP